MPSDNRGVGHTEFIHTSVGTIRIGTSTPTSPNLHEVAQSISLHARVAYTDNDLIILAHTLVHVPRHQHRRAVVDPLVFPAQ